MAEEWLMKISSSFLKSFSSRKSDQFNCTRESEMLWVVVYDIAAAVNTRSQGRVCVPGIDYIIPKLQIYVCMRVLLPYFLSILLNKYEGLNLSPTLTIWKWFGVVHIRRKLYLPTIVSIIWRTYLQSNRDIYWILLEFHSSRKCFEIVPWFWRIILGKLSPKR